MDEPRSISKPQTPLWRWVLPAVIFIVSVAISLRFQVLGRGGDMLVAYPVGLAAQLVFGVIGFWAAMNVMHRPIGSTRLALLNLAAVFAAGDAVYSLYPFVSESSVGSATIMGIVHLLLIALLFPLRPGHVMFVGAITFLVNIVGSHVVDATWYTWF